MRGQPAEIVRSLGPGVTVQAILHKLEMMHGAVYPFDVMIRRVFNIAQVKGESVTQFATKLEAAISNVQRDHPMQSANENLRNSRRDRFYQGLKKTLKESLRYLYNTGAPYEAILVAARTAEDPGHPPPPQNKRREGDGGKSSKQYSGNKGNCFGCGGSGHFIRDCPSKKSLNSAGGGKKTQVPPQNKRTAAATATEELDQEEETTQEDGQEQD